MKPHGGVRVAIDGRRLQDDPLGGVGRYFAGLIPRLALEVEVEVVVLTDARRPPPAVPDVAPFLCPLAAPPRLREAPWLHVTVPRWLRTWDGIFHGTFNALPFISACPSVVTVMDLSFEHHPEDYGRIKQRWFQVQARRAVTRAHRVLVPAGAVRADVVSTYGIDPGKVAVAPIGADPIFSPHAPHEIAAVTGRLGIPSPYVVAIGGARRRALDVAVAAWRRSGAADDGVGLVVVGPEKPAADEAGLSWVGPVADDVWSVLLAGAEAFVYPTRFEGFGMPALEAAASGTPVVCGRVGPLVEVLGDAAEWCDAPTVDGISAGLRRLLGDPARRDALRVAGLARVVEAPGWDVSVAVTLQAYRETSAVRNGSR